MEMELDTRDGAMGFNRAFNNAEEVKEFLASIPEAERYEVQEGVLQNMLRYHNRAADMIEDVFLFVQQEGAFRMHISDEEFTRRWAEIVKIVEGNKERRNKVWEAKKAIHKRWNDKNVLQWLETATFSTNFLHSCRRLGAFVGLERAARLVNAAAVRRLTGGKKWAKGVKGLTSGDFDEACKLRNTEVEEVPDMQARELGMKFGICGFLEEIGAAGSDDGAMELDDEVGRGQILPRPAGQILPQPATREPSEDRQLRPERARLTRAEAKELGLHIDDDDDSLSEFEESGVEEGSETEEKKAGPDVGSAGATTCHCSPDVPIAWKIAVSSRKNLGSAASMKLVSRMMTYEKVCHHHGRLMSGHVGLCTKRLPLPLMNFRLKHVLEHRLDIGKLKTDEETYKWFRIANRPARPSDGLGPYKYFQNTTPSDQAFSFDQKKILNAWDKTIIARWEDQGQVILPLFHWWFQIPELRQHLHDEFDLYLWHLREINGSKNIGWLRNMFHSIAQQLMRQDPAYYMLYAALRPDAAWRLVSYPYYAKYCSPGDSTFFCHIDLNIPDLLSNNRGASMIQGTVSMDMEDDKNCTFFLPGMQRKLGEWWARVVERGQETDGFVHRIDDRTFTKGDSLALGLKWETAPCGPGDARITLPSIPHGATGPTTKVRRTMFPWFVAIQDDEDTLEVAEGGTWSSLAIAHRDQTAPFATPSGLPNRYGAIPFRFPASFELVGLGALSDAMVCRRRWNSPAALRERDIVLGDDRELAHAFISRWRAKATAVALELYGDMIAEEKRVFGDKSYYYHLERFRTSGIPMPVVQPDVDVLGDEVLEEARKEGLLFAEDAGTMADIEAMNNM